MKTLKLSPILVLISFMASAQHPDVSNISLLGEKAPRFTAESTQGTLNFPEDFGQTWKLMISQLVNFTPVSSAEVLELAGMQNEFKTLDVAIIAVTEDSRYLSESWRYSMEDICQGENDPMRIDFPLVDDKNKAISLKFGMHETTNTTRHVRCAYIIDPNNVVRFSQVYPDGIVRSMRELKRIIVALQASDHENVIVPADWEPGEEVLLREYDREDLNDPSVRQPEWFYALKSTHGNLSSK